MNQVRRTGFVFTWALFALLASVASAVAAQLVMQIRSEYPYQVQVEFYSEERSHAWPGGDQAYNIDDDDVHTYRLECRQDEKICYGAWVKGNATKYWGSGLNGEQACDRCCFVCGGGPTPVVVLNR
jgi:hypothetical protein